MNIFNLFRKSPEPEKVYCIDCQYIDTSGHGGTLYFAKCSTIVSSPSYFYITHEPVAYSKYCNTWCGIKNDDGKCKDFKSKEN